MISLCNLGVLCVSVVTISQQKLTTEAQRTQRLHREEAALQRGAQLKLSVKIRAMPERIYRDPVHNIIRLQTDSDEGELMMRLIDAAEFQRLRRIKQLGLGLYTYQR